MRHHSGGREGHWNASGCDGSTLWKELPAGRLQGDKRRIQEKAERVRAKTATEMAEGAAACTPGDKGGKRLELPLGFSQGCPGGLWAPPFPDRVYSGDLSATQLEVTF